MPGAGFQRFASEARENLQHARNVPFEDVKTRLVCVCSLFFLDMN